jgi:hypothetical protein
MACTGTSLLGDNLSDASLTAVTSECRRRLQNAEGCHDIKAPNKSFWKSETGEILATYAKNSFHMVKISSLR